MWFQTGRCPHGHFCPIGTGFPYSYPCQAGLYRNNTLGHSGDTCVSCPFRHYCEKLGTSTPLICPQVGIYLIFGEDSVIACIWRRTALWKHLFLLCTRAFSVQKVHLLQSRVLKGCTVLVLLSVMGLSAPRVAEAGIAVVWDCRSHPEAAKSDSTADREPSLQYANDFFIVMKNYL